MATGGEHVAAAEEMPLRKAVEEGEQGAGAELPAPSGWKKKSHQQMTRPFPTKPTSSSQQASNKWWHGAQQSSGGVDPEAVWRRPPLLS